MTPPYFLDARHLNASGIGTYTRSILDALRGHPGFEPHEWTIAAHPRSVSSLGTWFEGVELLSSPAPMYSIKEQALFHSEAVMQARAIFLPHYPVPLRRPTGRLFVTVHDVLHALHAGPRRSDLGRRRYARTMLGLAAKRSSVVFTVSQFTASQLLLLEPGLTGRIQVAPFGVDDWWFKPPTVYAETPRQRPYLLYVGNVKPHKNLRRLSEAVAGLAQDVDLYIVGSSDGRNVDKVALRSLANNPRVLQLGQLDRESLKAVVSNAIALVMPSLYEGLGLPPLEAMATGTPVAVSDIPALRETCEDAAHYFSPLDVDDIRRALGELIDRPALRRDLKLRGLRRAQQRTARQAAETTIARMLPAVNGH